MPLRGVEVTLEPHANNDQTEEVSARVATKL